MLGLTLHLTLHSQIPSGGLLWGRFSHNSSQEESSDFLLNRRYRSIENIVVLLEEAVIVEEENRKLLSSEFVVYLKLSTSTQIERMKAGRVPLFPIPDLKAFLDKQHLERDHYYEAVAACTIEPISVDEDVSTLIKALNE